MYADGEMLLGRPGLSCTPSDTSSSSGFTEARPVSSVEGDALWLVSSYLASRPECAALSAQLNAILVRDAPTLVVSFYFVRLPINLWAATTNE